MNYFYEKAFWAFIALVGALIVVIYNLFQNKIELKIKQEISNGLKDIQDDIKKIHTFIHQIKNKEIQSKLLIDTLKKCEDLEDENKKLKRQFYESE